ncbi:MAG: NAD(P)H-dependent oxidoreductase [Paracoccaceae bacterium]|jgi:chromate reductase|nr:NAD(P)H-dependent oxidoreductase [Paracoccaceae bacterium]
MTLKLLGMCGSLRAGSWNRKLMHEAARRFGAAEFVAGDLRVPLYDGDAEDAEGIPPQVQRLAEQVAAADAVLLVTPEYNQSPAGVMKNALDWISRVEGNPWRDKPVAMMSAAAGRAGGARAQYMLRLWMIPFRPWVIPGPEVMVAGAAKEFDDEGRLISDRYATALDELMAQLRQAAEARRT